MSLVCNKVTMRADFDSNCRQGKTSVVEFKETFINSWKTLVANGEKEVPEEELAMMFLLRLDMTRYGAMYTEMQNDADKGLPFPTTVHQAYTIAANRKEYKLISGTTYSLSGIDGASSDGLKIDRGELFRDFSKLGRSMGCSPVASANVLSMGDCVDKGYQVKYSSDTDEFIVNADVMTYVFKRKLYPTGRKSKHYVTVDISDKDNLYSKSST